MGSVLLLLFKLGPSLEISGEGVYVLLEGVNNTYYVLHGSPEYPLIDGTPNSYVALRGL